MLIDSFDSLLLDLDGVVYRGKQAVVSAVESITRVRQMGKPVGYITNNASRTPAQIAEQLRELGIAVREREIIGAAKAAAKLLASRIPAPSKVLVVGGEGLSDEVAALGFSLVSSSDQRPEAVIQGLSPDVGWRELAEAAFAIQKGAIWIATNQDWTLPLERGFAPGNGTLVGAVHAAVGILPEFAGKPFRPIFDSALVELGFQNPLVIGDRLDTDIKGAVGAGLQSAAVLTGIAGNQELLGAKSDERPNYILSDLSELFLPYPPLKRSKTAVNCGASEVQIVGDRLMLSSGNPTAIDTIRAAADLVWSSGRPIYGLRVDAKLLGAWSGLRG
jgi:HAD superfamily hydrolase (TIGR01450 family)